MNIEKLTNDIENYAKLTREKVYENFKVEMLKFYWNIRKNDCRRGTKWKY